MTASKFLVGKPRLLLLDEPSAGLAPVVVKQIAAFLRKLAESGMPTLLVEQNVDIAIELCNRFVVLKVGMKTFEGDKQSLGDSPRTFLANMYL